MVTQQIVALLSPVQIRLATPRKRQSNSGLVFLYAASGQLFTKPAPHVQYARKQVAMDSKESDPSHPSCSVIDLAAVRRLRIIVSPRLAIRIQVRMVNVYQDEARAYRLAGLPVPVQVLEDAERWEREHGRL